jgi:hypothetical protein
MELHIDCLLDDEGRILMDRDIRVEFFDGEILAKNRRSKEDKAKAEVKE